MLGRVVPFEPLGEAARFGGGEGRIERGRGVRAEIVLDQDDFFGARKMHVGHISWVKGYEGVMGPMEGLSSLFYEKALKPGLPTSEPRYRKAPFHLLASQTGCYRYWGQGIFVDYGREICRRGADILTHDF